MKKILLLTIISLILVGCGNAEREADSDNVTEVASSEDETMEKEEFIPEWRTTMEPGLVEDIDKAFTEIGENPRYILSVEYDSVRKTDLFDRKDYKVTFDKGNIIDLFDEDDRKFVHAVEYRITTEEWHEDEPEREQYPREYLVTIKFWFDDNTTNINQWMHTGGGELQDN